MINYFSFFDVEYSSEIRTMASRCHPLCQQPYANKASCLLLRILEVFYKSGAAFIKPDFKK